jgi:phospholipid transport system substrate-binding protein
MRIHPPILCALSLLTWLGGSPVLGGAAGAAYAATPAAPAGPKATLQRLNGDVDKRLRQKTVAGSAEDTKLKDEVKELASELLDYGELCKRALGEHWDKMPVAQRTDFVATLKELIERNYVKQLKTNLDYQVTYGDESIDGSEARVTTTVKIATKGKATEALIEYRMIKQTTGKTAGQWMVYDVITDELSLVRNYRTQFQRIITSNGYDGLLNKMKTKLNEERVKDGGKPVEAPKPAAPKPATPAAPAKKAAKAPGRRAG